MAGGVWESTLVIIQNMVSKRCTGYYSNTQMFRQETDKQFYTWPSVVLTRHYSKKEKEEKKICAGLKASEFASPAIKAALTPNMDPARNEHWNLLTLPLGINHMHTKKNKTKNKQCTKRQLTRQIEWVGKLPKLRNDKSEYDDNIFRETFAPWKEKMNIRQHFRKCVCINVLSILCIKFTSCASFWHSQA